ncbi:MAG: AtpZ/AtpI family protein [Eubacterium sp.]|nr:AtpZ/AtpI family protein [Eubacterium sp.]
MRKRDDEKNKREVITALSMILQIGLALLVCMGMSLGIGFYLDKLFGTKFILIIFMVIGFLASIRSMLVLTGHYRPGGAKPEDTADREPTVLEQYRDYKGKTEDDDK